MGVRMGSCDDYVEVPLGDAKHLPTLGTITS